MLGQQLSAATSAVTCKPWKATSSDFDRNLQRFTCMGPSLYRLASTLHLEPLQLFLLCLPSEVAKCYIGPLVTGAILITFMAKLVVKRFPRRRNLPDWNVNCTAPNLSPQIQAACPRMPPILLSLTVRDQ